MPYLVNLAFKNIFRQKKRSFTLGINYLVISMLILLLLSFSDGVKQNFSGNLISAAAGHITVSGETIEKGKTLIGIANYPLVEEAVQQAFGDEARVVVRYKMSSVVYFQGLSKSLSFQGIKFDKDQALRDQLEVKEGSWDEFQNRENGGLISRETADYLGIQLGDEVLISTRTRFGAFNTATIHISGIYESANYFVAGLVLTSFDFLQKLDLNSPDSASSFFVYFDNLEGIEAKRDKLMDFLAARGYVVQKPAGGTEAISAVTGASPQYKMLGEDVNEKRLTVSTVNEVVAILAQILDTVNAAGGFIAAIMLFVTAISIFINMRMTINDRMQEIGTLRAIGTERGEIVALLIFENVALSFVFVVLGIVLGLGVVFGVSNFLTLPPAGLLSLFLDKGHLVLIPTLGAMTLIITVTVLFTALFSYFPARHGGRINAAVALGKTY